MHGVGHRPDPCYQFVVQVELLRFSPQFPDWLWAKGVQRPKCEDNQLHPPNAEVQDARMFSSLLTLLGYMFWTTCGSANTAMLYSAYHLFTLTFITCFVSHTCNKRRNILLPSSGSKNQRIKPLIGACSKLCERLCGLVVRVPGYRSRGPGSIPGPSRFFEK
jgi:hypothetical protein